MLPQRNLVKRACVGLLSLFDRNYFSAREPRKSPTRRFTYHSDGMADARLFEMLDSIAIQVSPHSYRPVIESMFYDGVVNDGRLYTLRCFTSVMMIKYPWGKDYIRFEYKKFVKHLTPDRQRRHPRGAASIDLPAYHRCYSPPPPPPSDGVVRLISPPASPTPTSGGFRFVYSPASSAWPPASPAPLDYQPNSLPDYRPDSTPPPPFYTVRPDFEETA